MNKLTDTFALSNGVQVPCVGYGTYLTPDGEIAKNSVVEALNVGYRHIDTAFAYGNFHNDFMKGKVTLVGCPKLDGVNYAEKLTQIIANNDINSITVTRMTVPCCGGLPFAVKTAVEASGKKIPVSVVTISPDGKRM